MLVVRGGEVSDRIGNRGKERNSVTAVVVLGGVGNENGRLVSVGLMFTLCSHHYGEVRVNAVSKR